MLEKLTNLRQVQHTLNAILEYELAGAVRYTHYSAIAHNCKRAAITSWLRQAASKSQEHAMEAGEILVNMSCKPSMDLIKFPHNKSDDLHSILEDCLQYANYGNELYLRLFDSVQGESSYLEEYAERLLSREEHPVLEKFIRHYKSQERYRELFKTGR
jgi:bacterioferritin